MRGHSFTGRDGEVVKMTEVEREREGSPKDVEPERQLLKVEDAAAKVAETASVALIKTRVAVDRIVGEEAQTEESKGLIDRVTVLDLLDSTLESISGIAYQIKRL